MSSILKMNVAVALLLFLEALLGIWVGVQFANDDSLSNPLSLALVYWVLAAALAIAGFLIYLSRESKRIRVPWLSYPVLSLVAFLNAGLAIFYLANTDDYPEMFLAETLIFIFLLAATSLGTIGVLYRALRAA